MSVLRQFLNGQAAKAVVMILIGLSGTLLAHYSSAWWESSVAAAVAAVGVYVTPNAPKP